MPRISVKLIEERETFTNQNFKNGMSIEQANDALVQKYGMKMNPKRLKELFDANKQDSTHTIEPSNEAIVEGDAPPNLLQLSQSNNAKAVSNEDKEPAVFSPSVSPMRPTAKISPEGCLPIGELVSQLEKGEYPLGSIT